MTNEMIKKAKACESPEELLSLAKENGIEMSAEEATETFAQLRGEGELSDDELDGAAGGGCFNKPDLEEGMVVKWSSRHALHEGTCTRPDLFEIVKVHNHYSLYGTISKATVKCTECGKQSEDVKASELYNI